MPHEARPRRLAAPTCRACSWAKWQDATARRALAVNLSPPPTSDQSKNPALRYNPDNPPALRWPIGAGRTIPILLLLIPAILAALLSCRPKREVATIAPTFYCHPPRDPKPWNS